MFFEADCLLFLGHTEQSIQQIVGTVFEELPFLGGSYSSTDLARKSRQNLVGLFWCCELFSLAGNVYLLLFYTFLKLNNNISLSLSLEFPCIGVFPGFCLNF
jgi:hypothetical protein